MEIDRFFRAALKWKISTKGRGEQARIAKDADISSSYLNRIIHGENAGTEETRRDIAKAIDLPYEQMLKLGAHIIVGKDPDDFRVTATLVHEQSYDLLPTKAPVISWVQAGEWTSIDESSIVNVDEWVFTTAKGENPFALKVQGDSMAPEFLEDEIIIIDPDEEPLNGRFVVAANGDDEATFKQLIIDGGQTFLKPLNDRYPIKEVTTKDIRIIGVMVEKVKRYIG